MYFTITKILPLFTAIFLMSQFALADADAPPTRQGGSSAIKTQERKQTTTRLLEFTINVNDQVFALRAGNPASTNVLDLSPLSGFGTTLPEDGKPVSPLESQARESDRINKLKEGAKQMLRDAHNAKAQAKANEFAVDCERLRLLKKYADKNFVGFDDYPAEIRNLVKRLLVLENYFIKDHCPIDAAGNIKEDHSGHGHTH